MQDIQSIGGRFFGAAGGGDRRLRPHHNQNHQALKCPRCDSLNTKFCYYNNYNLSQPRHFCKSCRRYWTKGGVLRNVPVGGGCRKTKRSKPKSSSSPTSPPPLQQDSERKASSNSSSESSSLTAANTATGTATEAVSAPSSTSSASNLLNIQDSKFFVPQSGANANFEATASMLEQGPEIGMFSEIGSFTSLIDLTFSATKQQIMYFFFLLEKFVGGAMVSLQGPVICPTVSAKQAGSYTLPMVGPLVKARHLRSELWGLKGISGCITKAGFVSRPQNARKCTRVHCTYSSSSNGNGSMAENFNENDEDYVNSSVLEAGMLQHWPTYVCDH